jgi:hypothetical protein
MAWASSVNGRQGRMLKLMQELEAKGSEEIG